MCSSEIKADGAQHYLDWSIWCAKGPGIIMSLSWVLQHMEQRCYLDRSPCIKCLFFLTLACTLEDTVYQTACRKSSSNSESPRLQYICKPRYLKITHRSMIGKITVKTRHQQSSTKEINGPWCASTRRHGREQEGGNYNL